MTKIKKINVFSLAKFQGILGLLLGLLAGFLYSFGGLVIDTLVSLGWMTSNETPGLSYGTVLAFGALIGMPIIFAVAGFFLGILSGLLFNLLAPLIGGIKINWKE